MSIEKEAADEAFKKGLELAMSDKSGSDVLTSEEPPVLDISPDAGAALKEEPPTTKEEEPKQEDIKPEVEVAPELEDKSEPEITEKPKKQIYDPNESRDQIIHRLKTTDGMFKASDKKARTLEKENLELKQRLEALEAAKVITKEDIKEDSQRPPDDEFITVVEELPAVKKLKETYGEDNNEISAAITEVAKNLFDRLTGTYESKIKEINASIKPMYEEHQRLLTDSHYMSISREHPDAIVKGSDGEWEVPISTEIRGWIDSLPAYKQGAYKKVYSSGTADEIIDLLDDFKKAMGYSKQKEEPVKPTKPSIDKEALKETMKVTTKSSPVNTASGVKSGTYEDGIRKAWAD